MYIYASVSRVILIIPSGTSFPFLFISSDLIPSKLAPFISLLIESPICITSSAFSPDLFNAYWKSSFLGLYDLASSDVYTSVVIML